ncbi:hypothetical protein ORI98_15170 [Shewanella sp. ULN5]|uniref:hypothetical protein n=1 Tax=Shewanella sp. ULN5 TaxID=2994678 RepID=UPI00273FBB1E|nr:hypothetical protein [Shewanella sp. ULN5]MDP5147781.1 hypothetical protein [Shewanella sp. ULN5]
MASSSLNGVLDDYVRDCPTLSLSLYNLTYFVFKIQSITYFLLVKSQSDITVIQLPSAGVPVADIFVSAKDLKALLPMQPNQRYKLLGVSADVTVDGMEKFHLMKRYEREAWMPNWQLNMDVV